MRAIRMTRPWLCSRRMHTAFSKVAITLASMLLAHRGQAFLFLPSLSKERYILSAPLARPRSLDERLASVSGSSSQTAYTSLLRQ